MMWLRKLFTLLFFLILTSPVFAAPECGGEIPTSPNELSEYISSCNQKITETKGAQATLAAAIKQLNSQINLTTAQISVTENELIELEQTIADLTSKLSSINYSLNDLSRLFATRVAATYKNQIKNPFFSLLNNSNFSDVLLKLEYLSVARDNDQKLLIMLEKTRLDYDTQKLLKETKQKEVVAAQKKLASQKTSLTTQKSIKDNLLSVTKNDEKKYQLLLSQARSELEAIQNIIAGKGQETKVGEVAKNQVIAKVIEGNSCNSGGTHLHFIVAENGQTKNPFSFLSSVEHENCSGSSCGSGDADPFNPSGSWDWPVSPKIKLTQGYGNTWAVKNTWVGSIYNFHNGIDFRGQSSEVKAVSDGTLYRGSYTGQGSCALRYVRLEHKDSSLETFYLHVNYF